MTMEVGWGWEVVGGESVGGGLGTRHGVIPSRGGSMKCLLLGFWGWDVCDDGSGETAGGGGGKRFGGRWGGRKAWQRGCVGVWIGAGARSVR